MNLCLTRNFLYCATILFHISYTKRLMPPGDEDQKQKQIELEEEKLEEEEAAKQAEEEEAERKDRKKAQEEAEKELKRKMQKLDEEEEGEEYYEKLVDRLKTGKIKFPKIEADIFNHKWCLSVTIKEVCPNKNVTFWLYNRNVHDGYHLDEDNSQTIENAPFIEDVPMKILLHGYDGNKSYTPNTEIRPVYVKKGYNVISIDYHPVAQSPCSVQAYRNIVRVAKCFAKFLIKLTTTPLVHAKIHIDNYHIIGFDIGAQLAGKAGLILADQDIVLPRITSLDASLPVFFAFKNYISESSAQFVDAIHTNIMTYGKVGVYGHCDFYVNKVFSRGPCKLTDADCNHRMAAVFFGESINSKVPFCGYNLFSRSKTAIMGENCLPTTRGVYILTTNNKPPYARGCNESGKGNIEDEEPSTLIKVNRTLTLRI